MRKAEVFSLNELVFVDKPPLAVRTDSVGNKEKSAYKKFLTRSDGSLWLFNVQKHMPTINGNRFLTTLFVDCATDEPTNDTIYSKKREKSEHKLGKPEMRNVIHGDEVMEKS